MSAALLDLVHRYASYADQRRLDDLTGLFTDSGVLVTPGGVFTGPAAIRAHLALLERVERTEHLVTGAEFAAGDGPTATGRVAAEAHHVTGGTDHVWTLTYLDSYLETPGGWRFARREIDLHSTQNRPATAH